MAAWGGGTCWRRRLRALVAPTGSFCRRSPHPLCIQHRTCHRCQALADKAALPHAAGDGTRRLGAALWAGQACERCALQSPTPEPVGLRSSPYTHAGRRLLAACCARCRGQPSGACCRFVFDWPTHVGVEGVHLTLLASPRIEMGTVKEEDRTGNLGGAKASRQGRRGLGLPVMQ